MSDDEKNIKTMADQLDDDYGQYRGFADGVGKKLASTVMAPFVLIWWVITSWTSRLRKYIPGKIGLARKAIKWGYAVIYDTRNTHFVVNTIYPDGAIIPQRGSYNTEEKRIETSNGEWFEAPNGVTKDFVYDTPVVHAVAGAHQHCEPVKANIAEAIDLTQDRWHTVKRTAEGVVPVKKEDPFDNNPYAGQQAAADGGVDTYDTQVVANVVNELATRDEDSYTLADAANNLREYFASQTSTMELKPSSTFDDIWVDVSLEDESNDGRIISFAKAREMYWSAPGTDVMHKQEEKGRLAELKPNSTSDLLKGVILGGGLVLAMAFVFMFFGGDGGSSAGNINPFVTLAGWWL